MPAKTRLTIKSESAICPGGTTLDRRALARMKARVKANGNVDALADFFSVVGNPQRLRILLYLTEAEELCVCDIADLLDMNVTAASAHLNKMKMSSALLTSSRFDWPVRTTDLIRHCAR